MGAEPRIESDDDHQCDGGDTGEEDSENDEDGG